MTEDERDALARVVTMWEGHAVNQERSIAATLHAILHFTPADETRLLREAETNAARAADLRLAAEVVRGFLPGC
jgi:hypothetical protein